MWVNSIKSVWLLFILFVKRFLFFILVTPQIVSAAVPTDIPQPVQGQQVILTHGAGGLSTMALSQVLLPGTSSITNAANGQPIYFTTQVLLSLTSLLISAYLTIGRCVDSCHWFQHCFFCFVWTGSSSPEYSYCPTWSGPNGIGAECTTRPDCSTYNFSSRCANLN